MHRADRLGRQVADLVYDRLDQPNGADGRTATALSGNAGDKFVIQPDDSLIHPHARLPVFGNEHTAGWNVIHSTHSPARPHRVNPDSARQSNHQPMAARHPRTHAPSAGQLHIIGRLPERR